MKRNSKNLPENSSEEKPLRELRGKRLYSIYIPQLGIEANGLLEITDSSDWILISYIRSWMFNPKAKFKKIEEQKFYWLNYKHTLESLPILKIKTKQGLSKRIQRLEKKGLIQTWQSPENSLYARLTELALSCYDHVELIDNDDPCETVFEQHNNLSSISKSPINQSSNERDNFFSSVRGKENSNTYQPRGKPISQDTTQAVKSSIREEKNLSLEALEILARLHPKSMPKVANGYYEPEPPDPEAELARIREMNRQRGFRA
jgi:DNA-binding MarR family transcriptional regulator